MHQKIDSCQSKSSGFFVKKVKSGKSELFWLASPSVYGKKIKKCTPSNRFL